MKDVDFAQLRALGAVVAEGSFDAAAAVLHVTPSAISQRIKALEQSAGQVLVQRAKPVVPTEAGWAYVRLARQIDALVHEAVTEADQQRPEPVTIPLAVNADSLATWLLPALAGLPETMCFDLQRDDQARTAELLRSGVVMAAITSVAEPVQGCRSILLGRMRYQPMAAPAFVERWFAGGVDAEALAVAPVVVFDRSDRLQDDYLARKAASRLVPPRHHVPASSDFAAAVRLGLGWGMLPDLQVAGDVERGDLIAFDPEGYVDVPLYWQQWSLRTPALEAVATAIRDAASDRLDTVDLSRSRSIPSPADRHEGGTRQ